MNNYIKGIGASMAGIALQFAFDAMPVQAETLTQNNIQVTEQLPQSDSPKIQQRLRDMKRNPDGSPINANETRSVSTQESQKPFEKFDRFVEFRTVGTVIQFRIINNPSQVNTGIAIQKINAYAKKINRNLTVERVY
jgi:hypothetical protein